MRRFHLLGLGLTVFCFVSCRERTAIEPESEPTTEADSGLVLGPSTDAITETPAETMVTTEKLSVEPPIIMEARPSQRVESLSFAHGTNLCVQVNAEGQTSLQTCDAQTKGQKFLFSRSLDGRIQLKDTNSQRCLAVGPAGLFTPSVLRGEVCESKASQFFSLVDYGMTYSLKFDSNNTCIDAERSRAEPGTRLILSRCSAVLNQKIQLTRF